MFHSIRSTPLSPAAIALLAPHTAANDSVAPAPVADVLLLDFRCGRTGTRNRDIWSELPDIRSARQARRLQHWISAREWCEPWTIPCSSTVPWSR